MRVLYDAGPGEAFEAFQLWKSGSPSRKTSHVGYSWQVFDACRRHGFEAMITCTHPDGPEDEAEGIRLVRRKDPRVGRSGLGYHRAVSELANRTIRDATDFGADLVMISGETVPWHYRDLTKRGVHLAQSLHSRIWLEDQPLRPLARLRLMGFARAYRRLPMTVLSASDVLTQQVKMLAKGPSCPVLEFLPLYRAEYFSDLPAPASGMDILFIGRVEVNKGVLDLVDMADQLRHHGVQPIFHICGDGKAMGQMKDRVSALGLEQAFRFHGWCDRAKMREVMAQTAISIVPTRSDFVEGFNQVAVESVLGGRPVIVSDQCPAWAYLGEAAIPVRRDDVAAYVDAILHLARDRAELERRKRACATAAMAFLEEGNSYSNALDRLFTAVAKGQAVESLTIPTSGARPLPLAG